MQHNLLCLLMCLVKDADQDIHHKIHTCIVIIVQQYLIHLINKKL